MVGKMPSIKNAIPKRMIRIVPDEVIDMTYVKVQPNDIVNIIGVIYSTYPAHTKSAENKNERVEIVRKDGSKVLNTSMYIIFDNETYTTSKNDMVFSQLFPLTGYIDEKPGKFVYKFDPVKVKIIPFDVQYGNKTATEFAFEPIE